MNYCERLEALNLKSQERRLERYWMLYTWKFLEGPVPNCGVDSYTSERNGRLYRLPPINNHSSPKVKFSLNSLPKTLRNLSKFPLRIWNLNWITIWKLCQTSLRPQTLFQLLVTSFMLSIQTTLWTKLEDWKIMLRRGLIEQPLFLTRGQISVWRTILKEKREISGHNICLPVRLQPHLHCFIKHITKLNP